MAVLRDLDGTLAEVPEEKPLALSMYRKRLPAYRRMG